MPHSKKKEEENVTVQNGITGKFVCILKPPDGCGETLGNELYDVCVEIFYLLG